MNLTCPTGLLDWEALGDEDVDADGCRDAPLNIFLTRIIKLISMM